MPRQPLGGGAARAGRRRASGPHSMLQASASGAGAAHPHRATDALMQECKNTCAMTCRGPEAASSLAQTDVEEGTPCKFRRTGENTPGMQCWEKC
mmetsp:Transcript_24906/g.74836  ORF Transcript_24906/g.74836 Transcript_24906/m.74836 type:complete len:95 (+) Transcript_24906:2-286(+)